MFHIRRGRCVLLETDDTVVEAAEEVRNALDWYEHGADFADALHLAACGSAVMHSPDLTAGNIATLRTRPIFGWSRPS